MSDPLGLSVGAINLVAVRTGRAPVMRRAVVTLFDHGPSFDQRPPEVGAPDENPELAGTGLTMRGFVERIGDPVPLVAPDGSTYRGEQLAADALDALGRSVGYGAPVWIAVPAHWGPGPVQALRTAVQSKPGLTPERATPILVDDATAAIAALRAEGGLPADGTVVLCDFGGSGTSITLVDATLSFAPIGPTVRYPGFSGAQTDQDILEYLLARLSDENRIDPARTAAVGSLARLRDACRAAKERLSEQAATTIAVELAEFSGNVGLTREELTNILSPPLAGALDAVVASLARNRVPAANVTAVAMVGGGANIPAVGARLSERLRATIVTTSRPDCAAATGAAILASREPPADRNAQAGVADTSTSMEPTAWAAGAAGAAATESATDGDQSATFRALAWSQDDSKAHEPVPYAGADYSYSSYPAPGSGGFDDSAAQPIEPEPLPWYKRPVVLFGLAAALALAATGGLAYTLTAERHPTDQTPSVTEPGEPSGADQNRAPSVVTVTVPGGGTSLSTIPAPPAPSPTDTTTSPSTTATESTSDTTQPTTTTSTHATTAHPTTSPPPSTTEQPAPSTAPAPVTAPTGPD